MKNPYKKGAESSRTEDESLFGLLSSYKSFNTYLNIYLSEKDDQVVLLITDNPRRWSLMADEKYKNFKPLRRLSIGVGKLSVKFLLPEHLVRFMGPMLGMKLPSNRVAFVNNLDKDGYFLLETSLKFLPEVMQGIKKIIGMPPQKKYEILEKCLVDNS
jgi:hypothetical protein